MASCANCGYAKTPAGKTNCYQCGRPLEADTTSLGASSPANAPVVNANPTASSPYAPVPNPGDAVQAYTGPQPVSVYVQAPTIVVAPPSGPGFGVRVVWYLFVGWWLTGIFIVVAYLAAISIIGLPLGFYMFNRIPTVLTLRPRTMTYAATPLAGGGIYLQAVHVEQRPMWQRAVWFVCVGWWLGAVWMGLAYVLCLIIIGLPFGIMMFDRVGGIMTLHRH